MYRVGPTLRVLFSIILILATSASAQKIKVIVDQDARGPGTSDQQALLVFVQSEKFDVLGITTVSGDQWVKEETQHTLRMLEIAGRTDVPVIQGAEFPLLNTKEETERWEALYGKLEYKGCWTEHFQATRSTIYDEPYHAPDLVPPMDEGQYHQGWHSRDRVSGEVFSAGLHVGRNRRRRPHRSLDHHRPEAALHGYRRRSRRQLRQNHLLELDGAGSTLLAFGQRPVRHRRGKVLQNLHRPDDAPGPKVDAPYVHLTRWL